MTTIGTRIARDTVEFRDSLCAEYRDAEYIHFEIIAMVLVDDAEFDPATLLNN